LSKSHDLLMQNEWKSVKLDALASEQLASFKQRVSMAGPAVELPADIATPLGLILHELATNAVKYGALSKSNGSVDLRWETMGTDGQRQLRIVWTERDGPEVSDPTKRGLGRYLLENGLPGAQVSTEFRRSGLACSIQLSLAAQG